MIPEDKPIALPVKDYIIKKTAIKLRISESIVEEVIAEQFKGIIKAMENHSSVEISGFGVFHLLPKKTERYINMLKKTKEDLEAGLETTNKYNLKFDLDTVNDEIRKLENKISNVS